MLGRARERIYNGKKPHRSPSRRGTQLLRLGHGCLLCLGHLVTGRTDFGPKHRVPPSERAGIIAEELLVVDVVVIGAGPERQDMVQAPWELISRVGIDGLEESENNPGVHGQDVEVLGHSRPDDGHANGTEGQNHRLDW